MTFSLLGTSLLYMGLFFSFACVWATAAGHLSKRAAWWVTGERAFAAILLSTFAATIILWVALLGGHFELAYVYQYTNTTMPVFYKFAALWGGQNGSLLFWVFILCLYGAVLYLRRHHTPRELRPYVFAVLSLVAMFFFIVMLGAANPFDSMPFTVDDGQGLNPLLQNYYMTIHPPSLYFGYVGMTVPFAFGMAALVSGRLDNTWIIHIRKWTLTTWFFLSLGNLLGASWAYEVLGWGGYWAWDPVENAAFMPWLTATAFLHSVIIQEKRNMLKVWNMVLVILSFLFTLTGTFLTRSGVVSSVHSFAQSDVGAYFLSFLLFWLILSTAMLLFRLKKLESENILDSFLSREAGFLLNNLVFLGSAFAILWGTLFPVLSEWVRGVKITTGPTYFNGIMVPLGLLLLLLMGIGPLAAYKKTSLAQLKRNFLVPVIVAILTSVFVFALVSRSPWVVMSFSFSAFVLVTLYLEYKRGIAVRRKHMGEPAGKAVVQLIRLNPRRYGGYIVHFGVVLMFIGFTGDAFKEQVETQLVPGQAFALGDYTVQYQRLYSEKNPHKEVFTAELAVWKGQKSDVYLRPARVLYESQIPGEPPQPGTDVAISRRLFEDLYAALLNFDPKTDSIFLKAVINPLVSFIWFGGLFLMLGTLVVMWPSPHQRAGKNPRLPSQRRAAA